MSCNMFEYYEVRQNGKWVEAELHPLLDFSTLSAEEEERAFEVHWAHPLSLGQDYNLFAVLADVRNYAGIKPISPPRGLPEDVSASVREKWEDSDRFYSHHPSWFSLEELLSFDWDQPLQDLNLTEDGIRRRMERNLRTYRDATLNTGFVSRCLAYLQTQIADANDLRMVFWFKN